jgi:hypothetical protein
MADVCVWYIVNNESSYLKLSIEQMSSYHWVKSIIVLNTKDYGYGFDKAIAGGGFDEISARNKALSIAEATGYDWLLQCDADEFYTENTGEIIDRAALAGYESVAFEFNHFITPTQYIINKRAYKHILNTKYHDLHVRAWKSSLKARYFQDPNEADKINPTINCIHNAGKNQNCFNVAGFYHIHVHHMIGPKKQPLSNFACVLETTNIMPEPYIKAWKDENLK